MLVCLGALEVYLRNTCQGSSVITSVKSGGEREKKGRKGRAETDGGISGEGEAIKRVREGKRENRRDTGGTYRVKGRG